MFVVEIQSHVYVTALLSGVAVLSTVRHSRLDPNYDSIHFMERKYVVHLYRYPSQDATEICVSERE